MVMVAAFQEKKPKEKQFGEWKLFNRTCSRCGGLMVIEQHADFPARRCVQCGEVIDPVILENRQRQPAIGIG